MNNLEIFDCLSKEQAIVSKYTIYFLNIIY